MALPPETAVSLRVAPSAFAPGGSPSSSNANRCKPAGAPATGSGSGNAHCGVGPSANSVTGVVGGDVHHDARLVLAGLAMHGADRELAAIADLFDLRDAGLGGADRCFGGRALVAVEQELKLGLRRHAKLLAHRVIELQPECRGLCRIGRYHVQRQHHIADISDRLASGAIGKLRRRGVKHSHGLDVLRLGKVQNRRHAGVTRIPPVGMPALLQHDLHTGTEHTAFWRITGWRGNEPRG